MQRPVRLVVLACCLLLLAAPPASAHGRGADATNFLSLVTAEPDLPGVRWRVYGGDELLGLDNRSGVEVLVLGYQGEPYLRVGPDGVWENRRSPATYQNRDRFAQVGVPPEADPEAAPEWDRVSGGTSHAWHDHRIHWMSPTLPPQVADVDARTLVQPWEVPVVYDGAEHTVTGELWWVPGPPVWPWLAVALLCALPALAGVRTTPADERWTGLARPASVVLGAVAALNLAGVVDDVAAVPMPAADAVWGAVQTVLYSALGLAAAVRGWRGDHGGFVALAFGAGLVALGQGLLVVGVLAASQLATVFPPALSRGAVALSLVQVLPVGVVAFLGTRRLAPAVPAVEEAEKPPALP